MPAPSDPRGRSGYGRAMSSPWPQTPPTAADLEALRDAETGSFWRPPGPSTLPQLVGDDVADLCIVGAGYTGLWAALHAKHDDPAREVVVVEGDVTGAAASSRNGGFVDSSLTHGISNGLHHFADEIEVLERLGLENFDGLRMDLARHGIDCDFETGGHLSVFLEEHQEAWVEEEVEVLRRFGHDVEIFDGAASAQAVVASPLYRAAVWKKSGSALVDPGKLASGLRDAALKLGVRIYERSPVLRQRAANGGTELSTEGGRVRARRTLLATGAHPSLLAPVRRRILPVYDYVLMSEPLSAEQRDAIGWEGRQGISDVANQFHYYRRTADGRILFGGYDAVYRYGGPVDQRHDASPATFARLSQHFFTVFPQLRGLRFTHRWGGAIDTCSRFSVFAGTSRDGRISYAAGYTGLGVAATRFGARVALDLLDERSTEATRLRYVRRRPVPFPPEPLRYGVVQLTRNRLAAADRREGRRGLWLRTLDGLGVGFDS